MRKIRLRILQLPLLFLFLLAVRPGYAIVIDVDPDSYAAGTDISNVFPGVVLSTWHGEPGAESLTGNPVYAVESGLASTGSNVFGWNDNGTYNEAWGNGTFEYMRADFSEGASWVALDFIANDQDTNAQLLAFDYLGVLVDSAHDTNELNEGDISRLSVSGDISYIQAYWDEIARTDNGLLDNLSYEPGSVTSNPNDPDNNSEIPAPGTIALLALGLAGIGAGRRRR